MFKRSSIALSINAVVLATAVQAAPKIENSSPQAKSNPPQTKSDSLQKVILLDTIVVSATKTDAPYKSISQTVNVLDQEDLQEIDASNISEALDWLPGVSIQQNEPFYAQPVIRGLGRGKTLITVDGLKLSYVTNKGSAISPLNVDPFLIKRVEVNKGSSSALYGSGGIGGVIALQTKKVEDLLAPNKTLGGFVRTQYGEVNHRFQTTSAVYGADVDKKVDWLITASTYRTKNEGENDATYRSQRQQLNALFGYNIDEAQRVELKISEGSRETKGYGLSPDSADDRLVRLSYNINRGDNLNLKTALGYNQLDREAKATSPMAPFQQQDTTREHFQFDLQNTQYLTLSGIDHELTYGLSHYGFKQKGLADGQADTFLAPEGVRHETGVFVQDRIQLSRVSLTTALRYNHYEMTSKDNPDVDDKSILPSLGVNFYANDWLSLHANYSHEFRAPSVDELYTRMERKMGPMTIVIEPNPDLKPESSRNLETGFSIHNSQLFTATDTGLIRVTAFKQDFTDRIDIERLPNENGIFRSRSGNTAAIDRTGVELEAFYKSEQLSVSVSTDYMRSENKETNEVRHFARTLKLRTSYHFAQPDLNVSWLAHAMKGHWVNDLWNGREYRGGYVIHNLNFQWNNVLDVEALTINAGIHNVFNTEYKTHFGFDGVERNMYLGFMAKL